MTPEPRQLPQGGGPCLEPGDLVASRYRVIRLIGCGGMGEVYETHDEFLDEIIALKTLRSDLAGNSHVVKHFEAEIRLARKVTHSNVCRVFEVGSHDIHASGTPLRFFTMEFVPGETLAERLRGRGRLSAEEAFPIASQMAEGLQAAHNLNIVHGDFKSSNVLLVPTTGGDSVRITDFGLARLDPIRTEDTRTLTESGVFIGTLAYMSPEQMTGAKVTTASDIYSFGIVLFEMATGRLPFDDRHLLQSAVQRVSTDGIPVRSLVPDIDSRWETAIQRCLQRDPAQRFSSIHEVAELLREDPRQLEKPGLTRRDWLRAGALAAVPATAGGAFWLWRRVPYSPDPEALRWYQKGVAALYSMTYESARKALERSVAADSEFALAHASLAQAYDELDYSDRAKDAMLVAVAAAGETRLSADGNRRLRALQSVVSRDYDRAASLFQAMERDARGRDRAAAAIECGWIAQKRDKTDEAEAAYRRALAAEPGYAAAKLRLGHILHRRRDLDGAGRQFKEARELYAAASDYEGVTESLIAEANLLVRTNRASDALPIIEKGLASAQAIGSLYQQINLQLLQGVAVRYLGDPKRAGEIATRAIDMAVAQGMDNIASRALTDLGNSLLVRKDLVSAESVLRRALDVARRGKVRRHEARALLSLGSICEQAHRPREAREFIEAGLPFYRDSGYVREVVQATLMLGAVLGQQADFEGGIRLLRDALPQSIRLRDALVEAQVRERLAQTLQDQGDLPQALGEQLRAAELYGRGMPAFDSRLSCARLYHRLGRAKEAREMLSECDELQRKNPNAVNGFELAMLRAEMAYDEGRFGAALDQARVALSLLPAEEAGVRARLVEALVSIRTRRAAAAGEAAAVLRTMDAANLLLGGAAARLMIAEAFVAAGQPGLALQPARQALEFFEPRGIWESVWRARRASGSERAATRDALTRLKAAWPAADVERYLARPAIAALAHDL